MRNLCNNPPLRRLVWTALALFLSYLTVAMAMPAVVLHVTGDLLLGNTASGVAVGTAFLSTIVSRGWAGRRADQIGGKPGMFGGLALYALASILCLLSALPALNNGPGSYAVLICGRLVLGLGESLALVGMLSWSVATMGPSQSGLVMSVFGMGMYGAFAAGGPLGLWLLKSAGFAGLMGVCSVLPLVGIAMLWRVPSIVPGRGAPRTSVVAVLGRIWAPGAIVGLQGVGFAALGAFLPLLFLARGWSGAGFGFTCFGVGFVAMRLIAGTWPDRFGGAPIALGSLLLEIAGQALLWQASSSSVAMTGALLTGIGCSMVFPSMGREVVNRVPANLRGTAIGGFAAFQDVAYGATGPLAGSLADHFGQRSVFLLGALTAALGAAIALMLFGRRCVAAAASMEGS